MYRYLLFDLDGTLTDPGAGITNSVMYALKKFGINETDRTSLYKFIGPPLKESFRRYYDFSEEQCELGVKYYREYFTDKGMFENEVYGDIPELLGKLKSQGRTLIVATSKPEAFSVRILKYFDLHGYFDLVAGATLDDTRIKKPDIIRYALESCRIDDKSSAIMIGDREHDILGAKENGLDSLGVLYGYGSPEELEAAGADYIVRNPMDILAHV